MAFWFSMGLIFLFLLYFLFFISQKAFLYFKVIEVQLIIGFLFFWDHLTDATFLCSTNFIGSLMVWRKPHNFTQFSSNFLDFPQFFHYMDFHFFPLVSKDPPLVSKKFPLGIKKISLGFKKLSPWYQKTFPLLSKDFPLDSKIHSFLSFFSTKILKVLIIFPLVIFQKVDIFQEKEYRI